MRLVTKASELTVVSTNLEMANNGEVAVIKVGYGTRGLCHTVRICADRLEEYLQMVDQTGEYFFPESAIEIEKYGLEGATIKPENLISVLCGFELIVPTQSESWGDFFDRDAAEIMQIRRVQEDEARAEYDMTRVEGNL